jgi:hypothetical protein
MNASMNGGTMRDTATDEGYITADGRKIGGVATGIAQHHLALRRGRRDQGYQL